MPIYCHFYQILKINGKLYQKYDENEKLKVYKTHKIFSDFIIIINKKFIKMEKHNYI